MRRDTAGAKFLKVGRAKLRFIYNAEHRERCMTIKLTKKLWWEYLVNWID